MRNIIKLYIICDDSLLGTLKFVSKTQDCQQYGALTPDDMINKDVKDSKAYKTYYDFAIGKATPKKARKFKKVASSSRKLSPVLEEEPAEKPKRAKKPTKKSTTMPTAGVAIKDTPSESMLKKKTPAKVDRGKGDRVGSLPKVLDEQEDKTTGTNEGIGTKPGVPDVPKYPSESENESWEDSDDDDNDDDNDEVTKDDDEDVAASDADDDKEASDSEKTDEDENLNLNQNDDDEEEKEEECVCTPDSFEFNDDDEEYEELHKDVNVRLTDTEHEELGKEDEEMTDAGRDDSTQQTKYKQVKDDEHVTLTTVHDTQKTKGPMQSSSASSDFANQFLNLDNVPPTDTEVVSMINVKVRHEEPSTHTPPLLNIPVTKSFRSYTTEFEKTAKDDRKRYIDLVEKSVKEIIKDEVKSQLPQILPKEISDFATPMIQSTIIESLENVVLAKSSSQPQSTYETTASLTEFELKEILLDKFEKTYSLKRDREDKDKDKYPPAGSDQGLKKRKTSKDVEPSRGFNSKESISSSSKGSKSQSKSSGKSAKAEELVFETADTEMPQD
ncbi:hypothetical protein Tco_1500556 [Tanacetum coccineum]